MELSQVVMLKLTILQETRDGGAGDDEMRLDSGWTTTECMKLGHFAA